MKKQVEIMSNVDKLWLYMDHPTNMMVVTAFLHFEQRLDFERLKQTFKNRILCYDRFKKRVVRPVTTASNVIWEIDPKFDLRSHLHRIALPFPGNQEALEELISDLTSMPLDPTKPLWQAHYIERVDGHGSVLFIRIHHCIADSITLVRVLLSMTDTEPNAPWRDNIEEAKAEKTSSFNLSLPFEPAVEKLEKIKKNAVKIAKFISKEIENGFNNPVLLIEQARNTTKFILDSVAITSKILLLPADRKTNFKGELGIRKSVAWSDPLPLPYIKAIGKYFNVTANDIIVALVAGALRRYLQQCNNLVGDQDIRMAMPLNIRPLNTKIELGNLFSLILIKLPIHIDDPVLRIREVHRRNIDLKEAPDAAVAYVVLNALCMSSAKLAQIAASILTNKITGVFSNVPGPQQPHYLAGEELKKIMVWVPQIGGLGLGISMVSYNGTVSLGIATDTGLVADPKSILAHFENEFRMLLSMYKAGQMEKESLVINDWSMPTFEPQYYGNIPNEKYIRCKAITPKRTQCRNRATTGSMYCTRHLPQENLQQPFPKAVSSGVTQSFIQNNSRLETFKSNQRPNLAPLEHLRRTPVPSDIEQKPPKRYFITRIEGGPEVTRIPRKLKIGKRYSCVFGIRDRSLQGERAAAIAPEDLAKMRNREVQVVAVGEGVEIQNNSVKLLVDKDYTSGEAAIDFSAPKPGKCNLQILLLLDRNIVREISYDFLAVEYFDFKISDMDSRPLEEVRECPSPEDCHRLSKKELHILVYGGREDLRLQFIYSTASSEPLHLQDQIRRDLENKKNKFLSRYANSVRHVQNAELKPGAVKEFLKDLKELGDEIFNTLFIIPGQRGLQQAGMEMQQLLCSNCPQQIQILPGKEHLPWMFLSDGIGALGLRHGMEFILSGTSGLNVDLDIKTKPIRIICGLSPIFESQKLANGKSVLDIQKEIFLKLDKNRFVVNVAEDENQWLRAMHDPFDVIYAYCHGSSGEGDVCLWMTQMSNAINGQTILNEDIDWTHHPLVILAACTSGSIDPLRALGFSNYFMAKGSMGYIATEGQVPAVFASMFMRDFFEDFFEKGEKPIGQVLFDLRHRFLEKFNNPWGILINQFCRSEITVRKS